MLRYFLGFFITIGLLILLIVLLVGGGDKGKSKVPSTAKTLESYASSEAVARLTIDGPVNAEQDHRESQISIKRDQAKFEQIQGYNGHVIKSKTYHSTEEAYIAFLRSLDRAGFTKGNTDPAFTDSRGYCPLGTRYVFELIQDGKTIEHFWSTSCGGPKTFNGSTALNVTLFERQIPEFSELSSSSL